MCVCSDRGRAYYDEYDDPRLDPRLYHPDPYMDSYERRPMYRGRSMHPMHYRSEMYGETPCTVAVPLAPVTWHCNGQQLRGTACVRRLTPFHSHRLNVCTFVPFCCSCAMECRRLRLAALRLPRPAPLCAETHAPCQASTRRPFRLAQQQAS